MSVLHAGILAAGLAAIAAPIIIHFLMRRRRKPVQWGAMRFVIEAYQKTRRRLLLEQWLLLAARCLVVALIAVALARPLLGGALGLGASGGGRSVYLVIDNSLTAGALGGAGAGDERPALERHLEAARAVLGSLSEGDRVGVVALGAPAEKVVMPPSGNLAAVAELVNGLRATDARADVPGAVAQIVAELTAPNPEGGVSPDRTTVVLLSDWRAGSADTEAALAKLPAGVRVVVGAPAGSGVDNVSVAGLTPARSVLVAGPANAAQTVTVALRRSGPAVGREAVTAVRIRLDGSATPQVVGQAQVTWTPGQRAATATAPIVLPGDLSARDATLSAVIDADALLADNSAQAGIEIRDALRVGLIASARLGASGRGATPQEFSAGEWIALALRPREDPGLELVELDPTAIDTAQLAALDAVVVTAPQRLAESDWARLRGFALGEAGPGGMLLITPAGGAGSGAGAQAWTDAMTRGLGLGWTIAREPRVIDPSDPAAPRLAAESAETAGLTSGNDPLSAIRGELAELVRPVNLLRVLPVTSAGEGATPLLKLTDDTVVLWSAALAGSARRGASIETRRGLVFYLATAPELEWTDMPVKPLMVPLMQELVRQGVGRARANASAVAGVKPATPPQAARLRSISSEPGVEAQTIVVDDAGQAAEAVRHRGVFEALDARGVRRGVIVVNPDTAASDTETLDPAAVAAWLANATQENAVTWLRRSDGSEPGPVASANASTTAGDLFARAEAGRPTGPLLLLGALLMALIEHVLARRASHRVAPERRRAEALA